MEGIVQYWDALLVGVGLVVSYVKQQEAVKKLVKENEQLKVDFKEMKSENINQHDAIQIAKGVKFKEIREEFKESDQVLHQRIDRLRDDNSKTFDKLERKIDSNHESLTSQITQMKTDIISALNK